MGFDSRIRTNSREQARVEGIREKGLCILISAKEREKERENERENGFQRGNEKERFF